MAKMAKMVLACATVIEEMLPLLPSGVGHKVLDFGLHVNPAKLKEVLQEEIDRLSEEAETVILGYGLCSNAVLGLRATNCTLVVPRVDDCIAILLGSNQRYKEEFDRSPGTYLLSHGWIEHSQDPYKEYRRVKDKYDEETARWVAGETMKGYHRLVLIETSARPRDGPPVHRSAFRPPRRSAARPRPRPPRPPR